jgi:hypothetical protein
VSENVFLKSLAERLVRAENFSTEKYYAFQKHIE